MARRRKSVLGSLLGTKKKRRKYGYGCSNGFDYDTWKGFGKMFPKTARKITRNPLDKLF